MRAPAALLVAFLMLPGAAGLVPGATQNDAASGRDAGDARVSAVPLAPGTWTGTLGGLDAIDTFVLSPPPRAMLHLTLTSDATLTAILFTPDDEGRWMTETTPGTSRLDVAVFPAGPWLIQIREESSIESWALASDSYTLAVSYETFNHASVVETPFAGTSTLIVPPTTERSWIEFFSFAQSSEFDIIPESAPPPLLSAETSGNLDMLWSVSRKNDECSSFPLFLGDGGLAPPGLVQTEGPRGPDLLRELPQRHISFADVAGTATGPREGTSILSRSGTTPTRFQLIALWDGDAIPYSLPVAPSPRLVHLSEYEDHGQRASIGPYVRADNLTTRDEAPALPGGTTILLAGGSAGPTVAEFRFDGEISHLGENGINKVLPADSPHSIEHTYRHIEGIAGDPIMYARMTFPFPACQWRT